MGAIQLSLLNYRRNRERITIKKISGLIQKLEI